VLSEAAVENDVIQIYTLKNFRVPNTYTIGQTDDQFLTKTSASAEYIPDSIVDAKGDLLAGTAADTVGRLAVGVDTAFLRPDSTASTGLKWDNDAWTSYTPTITNLTLGNGVLVAKYKKIGKTVFVEARVVFGSTTSLTGSPIFYLPSNQSLPLNGRANVVILDSGANYFKGMSADVSVNYFYIYAELASGSYVSYASISSTVPMTWTTNDTISISFFYEEA
jgi:hypothetical protein